MNSSLVSFVSALLWWLGRSSAQAAVIAGIVLAAQLVLGQRLPARWKYNLWLVVLVRLFVPAVPASPVSVFNFVPQGAQQSAEQIAPVLSSSQSPGVVAHTVSRPLPRGEGKVGRGATWRERVAAVCWPCALFGGWMIGVTLLAGRVAWASWKLHREMARCRVVEDREILSVLEACAAELRIARLPQLLIADGLPGPALAGLVRPRILLPADVVGRFDGREIRLILLHELMHLKRNDVAVNWMMTIAQVIHWFNPVLWAAFARCRVDRELACDEAVLGMNPGGGAAVYGETILKLLETAARSAVLPGMLGGGVGILERPHPLRRRIKMIASFGNRKPTWPMAAAVLMVVIAAAGLTDAVHAQNAQSAKPTHAAKAAVSESLPATAPPAPVDENSQSADEHSRDALMDRVLPEVKFDAVALNDVVTFLRDLTGANIVVNAKALESAGIDRNTPVTLAVKNVRFSKVLDLLVEQVDGNQAKVRFEYADRVLTLTAGSDEKPLMKRVVYEVEDLVQAAVKKATTQPTEETRTETFHSLVSLIQGHVAPQSWTEVGGAGTITEFNGKLVITTTEENHQEIRRLLEEVKGH